MDRRLERLVLLAITAVAVTAWWLALVDAAAVRLVRSDQRIDAEGRVRLGETELGLADLAADGDALEHQRTLARRIVARRVSYAEWVRKLARADADAVARESLYLRWRERVGWEALLVRKVGLSARGVRLDVACEVARLRALGIREPLAPAATERDFEARYGLPLTEALGTGADRLCDDPIMDEVCRRGRLCVEAGAHLVEVR